MALNLKQSEKAFGLWSERRAGDVTGWAEGPCRNMQHQGHREELPTRVLITGGSGSQGSAEIFPQCPAAAALVGSASWEPPLLRSEGARGQEDGGWDSSFPAQPPLMPPSHH